jgi:hypothetical protein
VIVQYKSLIQATNAKFKNAEIKVMMCPYRIDNADHNVRISLLNASMKEDSVINKGMLSFVDMCDLNYRDEIDKSMVTDDGVHLSPRGSGTLARALKRAIHGQAYSQTSESRYGQNRFRNNNYRGGGQQRPRRYAFTNNRYENY